VRYLLLLFIVGAIIATIGSLTYGGVSLYLENLDTRRTEALARAEETRAEAEIQKEQARIEQIREEQLLTQTQAELNQTLALLQKARAETDALLIAAETNRYIMEAYTDEAIKAIRDDRRIAGWFVLRVTIQEIILGLLMAVAVLSCIGIGIVWIKDGL